MRKFLDADNKQKIEWLSPKADNDYMDWGTSAYAIFLG